VRSVEAERAFAEAIDKALATIVKTPDRFLKLSATHRACTVIGFPYQVVYRVVEDALIVVAVAHTSRRPGYWRRRR
jgi:hypothetical protein